MAEIAEPELRHTRSRAADALTGRYLSLTTYKRDGTAVSTPVWFVQDDGRLLIVTDGASGKVKRIRKNPAVRVALCTASGRLRSRLVSGTAEMLPEATAAEQLIARKYRLDLIVIRPLRALQAALHPGRPKPRSVAVAITPDW
jgi:PPOX class probable F420-dependent enzyme